MVLSELIVRINDAFRGDETSPVAGTDEYAYWLRTANRKVSEWARDTKQNWRSNFDIVEAGTIAVGTQAYDLDDTLLQPSDYVIVTPTTGVDIRYTLASPQERERYTNSAYVSGRDPQILTFYDDILTGNQIVGGTLKVPGYYLPDTMAIASDVVPVDDPNWLVLATASELAFNDITYEDKYVDLNTKANALYAQMVSANRKGSSGYPRQARTAVRRINGSATPGLRTSGDW